MEETKISFAERFKIWFGIGALMFGTYCGANMASGVYATTYMVSGRRRLDVAVAGDLYCVYGIFLCRCAGFYPCI